ncbi:hypothetical protein MNBD_UNCLBAC01-208 [hydrothermal vent metagenome]|uniref:NfeD-like C-terminal domain-containing protein n=1 Tax=hydrothermal vent metagenome TaxID=652676 RepID=A0A3B1DL87_9ZZZZ
MSFNFFTTADMLGKVFWLCAMAGTLFFALRILMMLIGGDFGDDIDSDGYSEASDAAFEVFSINSITAFVMMFGWAGLTCHLQYALGQLQSVLIAFLVGVLAMLITAYLFQLASKLVDKGAVFKIQDTVGMNAEVYQKILANGRGKINVTPAGGQLRELDAMSADKEEIASFQTVKIVEVIDNNTVSVRKI